MTHKKIKGYVVSDVGLVRENNEDNYLLGHCLNDGSISHSEASVSGTLNSWSVLAVFDGMGGTDRGEVASRLAALTFQDSSFAVENEPEERAVEEMEQAFLKANTAILAEQEKASSCGTTGSVLLLNHEKFRVFHKGDSRIYLERGKKLYLLTEDQTLAQMKLNFGIYHSREEIPEKEFHQLTQFIGIEEACMDESPFETDWMECIPGDRFLLCSDGLYDLCSNEEILKCLTESTDLKQIGADLVEAAKKAGGRDNVTVLVAEIKAQE